MCRVTDGLTEGGLGSSPLLYVVKMRYMGSHCKAKFLETEGLSVFVSFQKYRVDNID